MDLGDNTLKVNRCVGGITEVHPNEGNELSRGRAIWYFEEVVENRSYVAAMFLLDTQTVNVPFRMEELESLDTAGSRESPLVRSQLCSRQ